MSLTIHKKLDLIVVKSFQTFMIPTVVGSPFEVKFILFSGTNVKSFKPMFILLWGFFFRKIQNKMVSGKRDSVCHSPECLIRTHL